MLTLGVSPVFAQAPPRPERPYRGVFGGGISNMDQTLIFNAAVGGGFSDTIRTGATATPTPNSGVLESPVTGSGPFEQLSLGLAYNLSRQRVSFFASAGSSIANYSTRSNSLVQSQSGSAGATVQLAKKTSFSFAETISYQPLLFSASLFGLPNQTVTQTAAVDFDAGAGLERVLTNDLAVGLTQGLTKRMSLSFNYADGRTSSASGNRNFEMQSGGARLTVALAKGLGLRLGYGFSGGFYGTNQRFRNGVIDAGLDFNRALSISRRMTLSFGTGFAAVTYGSQTEYTAIGNVTLTREIGRSWTTSVSYRRNLSMFNTLRAPVLYDSAMFSVNGLLSTRLAFESSAGVALGQVGAGQPGDNFRNYYGLAGVTYGMTRLMGLGVDYVYYRYNFENGVILPGGLAQWADRQTLLVSAKLWLPLLTRTRRVNVTR